MTNKSIFIGNYNESYIYYNCETQTLEASEKNQNSFNQSLLLGLILITVPIIKIIDTMMPKPGIEIRVLVLMISTVIGVISGYVINRKIISNIEFTPFSMNQSQFDKFLKENKQHLNTINWVMICSLLALFIEIYLYIRMGIFTIAFIFLLNIVVVTLIFLAGVHSRKRIYNELEKSYK